MNIKQRTTTMMIIALLLSVVLTGCGSGPLTATPTNASTATNTPTVTPTSTPSPFWVTLTSPNGDEVMTDGEVYRITWKSSPNIDMVSIMYKPCSSCGEWLAYDIPNSHFYNWKVKVGLFINTQSTIEILAYDVGVGSVMDESDAPFTMLPAPNPWFTPTAATK
ncbi:MAG: hypothetical protein WAN58_05460 [Anaerolineales bacterium]